MKEDSLLVERAEKGDRRAFRDLYDLHAESLCHLSDRSDLLKGLVRDNGDVVHIREPVVAFEAHSRGGLDCQNESILAEFIVNPRPRDTLWSGFFGRIAPPEWEFFRRSPLSWTPDTPQRSLSKDPAETNFFPWLCMTLWRPAFEFFITTW